MPLEVGTYIRYTLRSGDVTPHCEKCQSVTHADQVDVEADFTRAIPGVDPTQEEFLFVLFSRVVIASTGKPS